MMFPAGGIHISPVQAYCGGKDAGGWSFTF